MEDGYFNFAFILKNFFGCHILVLLQTAIFYSKAKCAKNEFMLLCDYSIQLYTSLPVP